MRGVENFLDEFQLFLKSGVFLLQKLEQYAIIINTVLKSVQEVYFRRNQINDRT